MIQYVEETDLLWEIQHVGNNSFRDDIGIQSIAYT